MTNFPESVEDEDGWCLRLFLSVDLVGSTAFKAESRVNTKCPHCRDSRSEEPWNLVFESFYKDFPVELRRAYENMTTRTACLPELPIPSIWKYLGDEILFYVTLKDYRHAIFHLYAFQKTLKMFSGHMEFKGLPLRCKGSAWLAGFPVNNIMIKPELPPESYPYGVPVDFIGSSIDCGFRLSRLSTTRKLVVSLDLALMLATAMEEPHDQDLDGVVFRYDGREVLKGVLHQTPYPIFWIDMEGDTELPEDRWLGLGDRCKPEDIISFCDQYIENTPGMIRPFIERDAGGTFASKPDGYSDEDRRKILNERKDARNLNGMDPASGSTDKASEMDSNTDFLPLR